MGPSAVPVGFTVPSTRVTLTAKRVPHAPTRARPAGAGRVDEGRLPGHRPRRSALAISTRRPLRCRAGPGPCAGGGWEVLPGAPGTCGFVGCSARRQAPPRFSSSQQAQPGLRAALCRSERSTATRGLGHPTAAGFRKGVEPFGTGAGWSGRMWSHEPRKVG